MIKVKTKVSGCFQTEKGARDYLKIMSYVGTTHKQGFNAYEAIKNAIHIIGVNYEGTYTWTDKFTMDIAIC